MSERERSLFDIMLDYRDARVQEVHEVLVDRGAVDERPPPPWFGVRRKDWRGQPCLEWPRGTTTSGQRARVMRGLHPMGAALGPEDQTCGSCANCMRREYHNLVWRKCRLHPVTHGQGSDIRLKWRACASWAPRPTTEKE